MADYSKSDHWAVKAQKEGYPARSVYKLKEIDEKFRLVSKASSFKALDLGAAPGSWSLYLLRKLKPQGVSNPHPLILAVDLSPLSREHDHGLFDTPSFHFFQGDFTSPEIQEQIHSLGPFNLVLSDAAPATSGNRSLDSLRSLDLAETALSYAHSALAPGGNFLCKIFQGGQEGQFLKTLKASFTNARAYKPEACRTGSFEVYYVGLGKK